MLKLASALLALGLAALQAPTAQAALKISDRLVITPYGDEDNPRLVPSYNISMPVDHFSAGRDNRTFNNRFFVNDTYYKPGGPVIFYDFGESGVSDLIAGIYMGGWRGAVSAPLELAKARNGVVIGWEHRYYGYSLPFPLYHANETDTYDVDEGTEGVPLGGAADYRYLTVAQALEDVAYFARRFNQTQLRGGDNAVLGGVNATRYLDPWHTPWIWVGGSYPGNRGTWMRLHNPDIIYAVWASSAPVQQVNDGSAYTNSIYRALPGNCTADIQAAVSHMEEIAESGNRTEMNRLVEQIILSETHTLSSTEPTSATPGLEGQDPTLEHFKLFFQDVFNTLTFDEQYRGYSGYIQRFCNKMETYDVAAYLANSTAHPGDNSVFIYNTDKATPTDKGIAASNGDRGPEVVVAAFLYALNAYVLGVPFDFDDKRSLKKRADDDTLNYTQIIDPYADAHAWEWQVLSEIGLVVNVNGSSPYRLGSKYLDYAYMRNSTIAQWFPHFAEGDIPAKPNNEYPMGFSGWRMMPSNTMFTNGEFDPWRAYGVASLEEELDDYPQWNYMRQDVPRCGIGEPMGHFGLVYPGAVHAEDMALMPDEPAGSQNLTHPPLKLGLELFQKALDVWLPCFNDSSTRPAAVDPNHPGNSTNSTGNPDKNAANPSVSAARSVLVAAGMFSLVFYYAL